MYRRPKPGETEDDILAMQQMYLAEKQKNSGFQPAAKLVNPRKHKANEELTLEDAKQSKSDLNDDLKGATSTSEPDKVQENSELYDDKVYFPSIIPSVLGNIVEKNVDSPSELSMDTDVSTTKDNAVSAGGSVSLFAQRLKNKKINLPKKDVLKKVDPDANDGIISIPNQSALLTGREKDDIHNANKAIIDGMSKEEILSERERIISFMNPETLKYIQSLKMRKINTAEVKPKIEPENVKMEIEPKVDDDMVLESDVISHPNISDWLNFDTLEKEKLEWIKGFNVKNENSPDQPYEARFNFKGFLLPYSVEYSEENKILFHHGEEPHRPGYTLNELFQLCRSTVIQQRSLALKTIAGIMEYYSLGIYNDIIKIPITKIYFVLRFALDENILIILEPALKALKNVFYYKVEESCLDFMLGSERGLLQPRLISTRVDLEDNETEEAELKDFHLAELDLVNGALRTDILTRISYIFNVIKPGFICTEYCLHILIRIARDSFENSTKILETDHLLEHIFVEYLPVFIKNKNSNKSNSEHHKLIATALKFIRVLISQCKHFAEVCIWKYKLMDSLKDYICGSIPQTVYLINVQIESFYLYSTLLNYSMGLGEIDAVVPCLFNIINTNMRNLNLLATTHNALYSYGTAIITLLTNIFLHRSDCINNFDNFIVQTALKLWSQISNVERYSGLQLKLITSVFLCLGVISKSGFFRNPNAEMEIDALLSKMINSSGFTKILSNLRDSSNLLSTIKMFKNPKGTNMYQLQALGLNSTKDLLPSLNEFSPISFISSLSKYLTAKNNKRISKILIENEYISSYILQLSVSNCTNLNDNWFTRIEYDMICNILTLHTKSTLEENQKDIVYNLSYKLSYILTLSYKNHVLMLFKNIIFNKNWFTTQRLMKNLSVTETSDIMNGLKTIEECYISVLNLNTVEEIVSLIQSNWYQPILPRDWMYMPILGLYTRGCETSKSNVTSEEKMKQYIVHCCLQWILVSEIYFPEITNEISLTDRFCRLFCVFLCDNSIFLDPAIKSLLEKCVKIIFNLEKSRKLNFDIPLSGISNFQDLYSQLIDQFQAVSYGDANFAACVLVPLSNKHNIKWRKLVWSEYAGCLRFLDCPEDMLCYPLDDYLKPSETDFSLLKCYHRSLNANLLRPSSITYKIAHSHVEAAKQRQTQRSKQM